MPQSGLKYCVAATCLSFVAFTAGFSADAARRASQPRRQQLVELVSSRDEQVARLERDLRALRSDLDRELESAGRASASERANEERARVLLLQAGAAPLEGRGLEVVMSDSDRMPGPSEDASLYRVHDVDIQLIVNALLSVGAEAVSVNAQRVVSTTAIRGAGETILVNFRPLVPPYVISAIGPSAALFLEHPDARRLARWEKLFGLGFRVTSADEVRVPAFAGQVALRHAEPARPPAEASPEDGG